MYAFSFLSPIYFHFLSQRSTIQYYIIYLLFLFVLNSSTKNFWNILGKIVVFKRISLPLKWSVIGMEIYSCRSLETRKKVVQNKKGKYDWRSKSKRFAFPNSSVLYKSTLKARPVTQVVCNPSYKFLKIVFLPPSYNKEIHIWPLLLSTLRLKNKRSYDEGRGHKTRNQGNIPWGSTIFLTC